MAEKQAGSDAAQPAVSFDAPQISSHVMNEVHDYSSTSTSRNDVKTDDTSSSAESTINNALQADLYGSVHDGPKARSVAGDSSNPESSSLAPAPAPSDTTIRTGANGSGGADGYAPDGVPSTDVRGIDSTSTRSIDKFGTRGNGGADGLIAERAPSQNGDSGSSTTPEVPSRGDRLASLPPDRPDPTLARSAGGG